jgi:deazaflavin-dependent oxidoreductase (nitroreductase family)
MPLPERLARFNRIVTNRIARRLAGRVPGFAIVEHVGRRSGRTYRTPVNIFRNGEDRYVIALTYGRDSKWVRNVLAAGGAEVVTRGRRLRLVEPVVVRDEQRTMMPAGVRSVLGVIRVDDFMVLRRARSSVHSA